MKKKHFYSHVIETSSISLALADMEMNNEERKHLIDLVEANPEIEKELTIKTAAEIISGII